jgi:hypothetical protein
MAAGTARQTPRNPCGGDRMAAHFIKAWRKYRGLTLKELAARVANAPVDYSLMPACRGSSAGRCRTRSPCWRASERFTGSNEK